MDEMETIKMRLLQRIKTVCVLALVQAVLAGSSFGFSFAGDYTAAQNAQTDQEQNPASKHNLSQVEEGVPTVSQAEFERLLKVMGLVIIGQGPGRHH
jgi:hypothetical protein